MVVNVVPMSVVGCVPFADVVTATGATNGTAAGGGSGVYTLIAPIGAGSAVGAAAACGNTPNEPYDVGVIRTGNEGVRLATVPAIAP